MENVYQLTAVFDNRNSFYGKAKVMDVTNDWGVHKKTLISYDTKVALFGLSETGENVMYLASEWDSSQTTLRHVKEFIKQSFGYFNDITKKDISKMIEDESETRFEYIDEIG